MNEDTAKVIGYCGLVIGGNGTREEPELAYELLRVAHGFGYAPEAGRAVVTCETGHVEPDAGYGDSQLTVREF